MEHPFRSAAIGGFNRQDVLDFLEEQAKQAARINQEMQGRLEESQRQSEELRQERDELERQLEKAKLDLEAGGRTWARLNTKLEQTNKELSDSRLQAEQAVRELKQVRQERDRLRQELAAMRPNAQAYLELKERTASVELEAHRRAQAIQEKAERDTSELRGRLELWLRQVFQEYDALRSDVEATVAHAASQLGRAGDELDQLLELLGSQDDAFAGLRRACDESTFGRLETPRKEA